MDIIHESDLPTLGPDYRVIECRCPHCGMIVDFPLPNGTINYSRVIDELQAKVQILKEILKEILSSLLRMIELKQKH